MSRIYALAGSFAMAPGAQKGVHVYVWEEETGKLTPVTDARPDINAGMSIYDRRTDTVYVTHEAGQPAGRGTPGGGGEVYALRVNREDGSISWISQKRTFASQPSYLMTDQSGRYLFVPHHVSSAVVTRTVQRPDGSFASETICEDSTILSFPIAEDGSIMDAVSVCHEAEERENGFITKIPHLHHIAQSPDGKLLVSCDKGRDVIHVYHLNADTGELLPLRETFVREGSHPRYALFHPAGKYLYQNCENRAFLYVWRYDSESGELIKEQELPLVQDAAAAEAWTEEGASDLVMTQNGRYVYVGVRGLLRIAVFRADEDGHLVFVEDVDCGGKNPRGLCISPDERFLYVMLRDSDAIQKFEIREDGRLTLTEDEVPCSRAANLTFLV